MSPMTVWTGFWFPSVLDFGAPLRSCTVVVCLPWDSTCESVVA